MIYSSRYCADTAKLLLFYVNVASLSHCSPCEHIAALPCDLRGAALVMVSFQNTHTHLCWC